MQLTKSGYEPLKHWDSEKLLTTSWWQGRGEDQRYPGFCLEVGWNIPREWWRPWILVQFWRWTLQAGWLYGGEND